MLPRFQKLLERALSVSQLLYARSSEDSLPMLCLEPGTMHFIGSVSVEGGTY